MRYLYTSEELLQILRSSHRTANAASPFRTLLTLNRESETISLTDPQKLLCAFALNPERVCAVGRKSAGDGELYLLNIGPVWYLYSWLEGQDLHVFEAFFDRPRLVKFLDRNFTAFYQPNYGGYTQVNVRLTDEEYGVFNLLRAYYALKARSGAVVTNDPILADDLKSADLALYLRNYLDELGFSSWADRVESMMEESHHATVDNALKGLEEKGLLTPDINPVTHDAAYRLTRTALERLEDGMLLDTLYFADLTRPEKPKEMLLCLRRDGVLAVIPSKEGVALKSFSECPWEDLI